MYYLQPPRVRQVCKSHWIEFMGCAHIYWKRLKRTCVYARLKVRDYIALPHYGNRSSVRGRSSAFNSIYYNTAWKGLDKRIELVIWHWKTSCWWLGWWWEGGGDGLESLLSWTKQGWYRGVGLQCVACVCICIYARATRRRSQSSSIQRARR